MLSLSNRPINLLIFNIMEKLRNLWYKNLDGIVMGSMVGILVGLALLWISWVGAVVVAVAFNVFCACITLNVRVVADL